MGISRHQKATLQAMGIDLYTSALKPDILLKPWMADLLRLLNISEDDCVFEDRPEPAFSANDRTLHFPHTLSPEDHVLKKQLWLACRAHISFVE
ncbi:hypothetical protein [Agaribacter flavus]|uniref:Uncharacterized protein n=1 Tax=Agaribacter flavus TaxID=1902781 RepID=A0ABV7FN79_9ALTE